MTVKEKFKFELYNIEDDIGETRDRAAEHPEIVERLCEELLDWFGGFERTRFTAGFLESRSP